jgi:hypothetical protein
MTGLAPTPALPEATLVGGLTAQWRRPRQWSATSAIVDSRRRLRANRGHSRQFANTGCGRGPRGRSCCSPLAAPPSCTAQDRYVASRIRGLPGGRPIRRNPRYRPALKLQIQSRPFPFWSPTGLSNCGHFLCGLNCDGDDVEGAKSARKLQLENAQLFTLALNFDASN